MNFSYLIDVFLHAPEYLNQLFSQYSLWAYILLFAIIFFETGVVITPFLPGDSIIFGVGAIAAISSEVNLPVMIILLMAAAILGDSLNYQIGCLLRSYVESGKKIPLVKQEHIERTQRFFEKHGGKTITIARFIPIIRTFAPFVSGASKMKYSKFFLYNCLGGIMWVGSIFSIGFFFGNIPVIKNHFSLVTLGIIFVSLIPVLVTFIKSKKKVTQNYNF